MLLKLSVFTRTTINLQRNRITNHGNIKIKNSFFCAAFTCHDQGASSLVYAPQHQLLISAGKKGDVCIFDVRQRVIRHRFQVNSICIFFQEDYCLTVIFFPSSQLGTWKCHQMFSYWSTWRTLCDWFSWWRHKGECISPVFLKLLIIFYCKS